MADEITSGTAKKTGHAAAPGAQSAGGTRALKDTVLTRFLAHKLAVIGLIIMAFMTLAVLLLPSLLHLDPYTSYIEGGFNQLPGKEHWLGTDRTGRDLFSRLVFGGRVSLYVGILSTLISMLIGVPLGLAAGYFRGIWEVLVMRVVDIFMSFPSMMLILVLVSVIGPSIYSITLVLGFLGWTQFTRLVYARVLSIREKDYIESAKAAGAGNGRILFRYVLPNTLAPALITMTFRTASAILTEASLSFLGMGVQPPTPSWGNIINEAQSIVILSTRPWAWIPPGLCLLVTVLSINFFGDGLRDALDPKMKNE